MARLPIPPAASLPPEGTAPVVQMAGASGDVAGSPNDAMSPTTMVLNYLKARGVTPTSDNVRRAMEAQGRDPSLIPGLRSDRPATDAEDQAAMAAAGKGGGRSSGNQRSSAPPAAVNPPNVDLGKVPNADEMQPGATGGGNTDSSLDLGKMIALGIPPALAASGLGAIYAMNRDRGSAVSSDPNVSPVTKANMATLPPATNVANPAPTGMEAAMQKAVGAPTVADMIAGPPAPTVAPGVTPPGAEMGPNVPFNRPAGGGAKVPPPEPFVRQTAPGITLGPQLPTAGPPVAPEAPNVPFTDRGGPRVAPTQPVVRPGTRPPLSLRPNVGPAADIMELLRGLRGARP